MHGPERLGLVQFSIDKIQVEEQSLQLEWEAQSDEHHVLRLTGELTFSPTLGGNTLPGDMWDRQRYGGGLSDGETQVWWITHDNDIPGRTRARWFDVIFVRRTYADTVVERMRSYETWRDFVKQEWLRYLRSGWLEVGRPRIFEG